MKKLFPYLYITISIAITALIFKEVYLLAIGASILGLYLLNTYLPYLKKDNTIVNDSLSFESVIKDRQWLLLLLANSFSKAGKLLLEKKQPDSQNIILVFQLKNGNIRFSVPEKVVPEHIRKGAILLNNAKINYNKNYALINELITRLDA